MNRFQQRKKDVLAKQDKSSIGFWDKRISKLCEKINSFEEYYTTSSCSGRVVLMIDQEKKGPGLFEFVSHDVVGFEELWKEIKKLSLKDKVKFKQNQNRKFFICPNLSYKFKQEPPIIHVACKDLKNAEIILKIGRKAGWKKSGILSLGKNIIVELNCSWRLEFPLIKGGRLLGGGFVKEVVNKVNWNLRRGWRAISRLEEEIEKF